MAARNLTPAQTLAALTREAKGKTRRVSEKQEQQAIVDLLRLIGAKVYVLGTKRRKGDYRVSASAWVSDSVRL